ncbi:FtsK/SpoIIIE domain-containing protein [Saccharopolyspora sp. ASAGF58]|uniref:FtsK/SpoIIIE domain-containing protein n=1 Tax=Saccharopolyspora sp. ASAGF58 TaxID=2719023 RepID=UPI001FF08D39|nr:FtsK/SpoIIIE domain-containing protein [Saccharopolyspora sp. ASAGF58]
MMPHEENSMGEVIRFPHRTTTEQQTTDGAVVRVVAERIDPDEETEQLDAPSAELAERPKWVPPALAGKAEKAKKATRDALPVGKQAVKFTGRHLYYLGGGAFDTFSSVYGRWTGRDIDAQIAAAQAAGEHGTAAVLMQQRTENRKLFLERLQVWGKFLIRVPLILAGLSGVVLAITLITSVVAFMRPDGLTFEDVWIGLFDALAAGFDFVVWAGSWAPWVGLAVVLGMLVKGYNTRRKLADAPAWTASANTTPSDRDVVPDEGAILNALKHLGFAPLTKAIVKGNWVPRWVSPTTRVGKGYHTQLMLPEQVTVEEIAKRKGVLAHNLLRKPVEVWPTEPKDQAGVLDLWVADQGILAKPVDPWPLLEDGTVDYFKGVPVALDARGDLVIGRLMAANYLIAGIMGSGKSSLVIALLLGAMLDPLVDIDVHVLAYNVDYDPMKPRLRTLVKGDDEEHIEAAMETLRALVSEVSERGRILEDLGGEEAKVTRDLAKRDKRLRPRVVVFDEVHELFTHKEFGKEAKELALKVTKKARKTAITMLWITPDADANSLPRGISKTASNRVAYAINDHQGNDAILGTGMHKRGYSATTLVAGEDIGTAMAAGFAKVPGLIRSFHIRKEKGIDEVTPVVQRALALREGQQPTATGVAPAEDEQADPLADIATVLGDTPRMRTQEVLQRLTEHNPTVYRGWTFADLSALLREADAGPYKSGGNMVVSADAVRHAITERDSETDLDESGE